MEAEFKYEDLRVAMLLLERNDLMFSFDLKSGYHHVDIAHEHWKYLGFTWKSHYYIIFTVLHFGLSSAGYIFTKLVCAMVGYRRAKGGTVEELSPCSCRDCWVTSKGSRFCPVFTTCGRYYSIEVCSRSH